MEQKRYDKLATEVPKLLAVTRSALCEKFKVNGSIARALIKDLNGKGLIKRCGEAHAKFDLFTGVHYAAPVAGADDGKKKKK